jgi:hypothetical protein
VSELFFEVETPLGVVVRTTPAYWARIVTFKHPVMRGREELVKRALQEPTEVRRSNSDSTVHLYYVPDPPYIVCVVVKSNEQIGFVVTAYRTDKIKEGEPLWPPR